MSRSKLHVPSVVATALLVGALVNVVQHPQIEFDVSDWYEAFRVKPDHDLLALSANHFESTSTRFTLYLQLGDVAPGAVIELSPSSELFREQLLGLGAATEVVRRDEEAALDAATAAALEPHVVVAGADRDVGSYAIALRPDTPVERIIVVAGPDRTWLVAEDLLAAARGGGA